MGCGSGKRAFMPTLLLDGKFVTVQKVPVKEASCACE